MDDQQGGVLIRPEISLEIAGTNANKIAASYLFTGYRERVAKNTRHNQDFDLTMFTTYMQSLGIQVSEALAHDPDSWKGITWGLVQGFVHWQLQDGFAINTVNRRLSTVKTYSALAHKAGAISEDEHARIQSVKGYGHRHGKNADAQREVTRKGEKKEYTTNIDDDQADALKRQPDTLQGRRDALIMCLLIDHGLRVGEVALLRVEHFNLRTRYFTFYRPKVDKEQKHRMSADTYFAATAYLFQGGPKSGPLWYSTNKDGSIRETVRVRNKLEPVACHMSERAIEERIALLGRRVDTENLSPHDLRHYWAFHVTEAGTDVKALQDAGGWNSVAMPMRYIKSTEVANERVKYKKRQQHDEIQNDETR